MRILSIANERRYYVSLGDAVNMDAYAGGPGRGAPALLYKNRNEDFPEWRGRDLTTYLSGIRLIPLAADGATAATVRYAQMPRLREMNVRPTLATLTVGGNDLLHTFGSTENAQAALLALHTHGQALLGELRRLLLPNAPLIIATLYDPSDGLGDDAWLQMGGWPGLTEWLVRFNETLRTLAAEHDGIVADLHERFRGHGLSAGDPTPHETQPENRALWYCGTLKPNAWGASAIRAAFWDALTDAGMIPAPRYTGD